jgi:hypothetical protein
MHASFASVTSEVDIEPTLVMLGLDFDDNEDEDDAPTRQVAPPSEVLGYEASGPATQSIPPESVPVLHVASLSTLAPTSMSTAETADRPVFALELLPLRPTALAVVGRAIVRWSPWALLGATTGLLLCVGVTSFVDAVAPTRSAAAATVVVASIAPAAPKPAPATPAALQVAPAAATFIELDDVRPTSTVAHRARPAAPAVRAAVRAPAAAPAAPAAPAARPPLAAMPSEYRSAR